MQPATKHDSRGSADRWRVGTVATLATVLAWSHSIALRSPCFVNVKQRAVGEGWMRRVRERYMNEWGAVSSTICVWSNGGFESTRMVAHVISNGSCTSMIKTDLPEASTGHLNVHHRLGELVVSPFISTRLKRFISQWLMGENTRHRQIRGVGEVLGRRELVKTWTFCRGCLHVPCA
jgi:hypothetical protein